MGSAVGHGMRPGLGRYERGLVVTGLAVAGLWIATVGVAAAAVEGVRRYAVRHSVLDVPNDRSSHDVPTPRGGGVAIAGVVLTVLVGWGLTRGGGGWASLAAGGLAVAAVSWVDDVRTLSTGPRFAAQALAALLVLVATPAWSVVALPGGAEVSLGVAAWPLAIVWVVGLTNAYNFMDGIDGIAGIQAVAAGTAWFAAGLILGAPLVAWVGGACAAASIGFLLHNWAPARIFMGDVGSAFLGFIFAGLSLVATPLAGTVAGRVPLASLLFVWPFVFDAAFTFLRRLKNGEDVLAAHRSHLYQRAVIAGGSHARVASLYGLASGVSGVCGLLWVWAGSSAAVLAGLVVVPVFLLLVPPLMARQGRR